MYSLLRSCLFRLEAERAHHLTLTLLQWLYKSHLSFLYSQTIPDKPVTCMGMTFPNAVGLAAGLDKDAAYVDALAACGFGFVELGSVTPQPQTGNPMPRLFRLPTKKALINRMGFNGCGLQQFVENLQSVKSNIIKGINIGKNKETPLENAVDDYLVCLHAVYPYADYITINISSPNTPGLRELQQGELLRSMLFSLKAAQLTLEETHSKTVPLVVKVSPDLTENEAEEIALVLLETQIEGLIVGNTSLSREGVEDNALAKEQGGLSGAPIAARTTQLLATFHRLLGDKITLIGMGGIIDAASAQAKFDCGASLVQIYTGLIYQGPSLIKDIVWGETK